MDINLSSQNKKYPVCQLQEKTSKNELLIAGMSATTGRSWDEPVAARLEEELIRLRGQSGTLGEQLHLQAEEVNAANEALQARNEELRYASDELETIQTALKSMNEDLRSVHQELKTKMEETSIARGHLQNHTNFMGIGTILLDRNFRVVLFTPAVRNIFNLTPADRGRSLVDITSTLQCDSLLQDAETALNKLTVIQKEVVTRDHKNYLLHITPDRTDEDRVQGVVITIVDATRHKKMEAALARSEEKYRSHLEAQVLQRTIELQRSNQYLMQFAHIISHDLNEPVRKVKTFAGLLESTLTPDIPEKAKLYLHKTKLSAERISNLIQDMLNYSKIGINKDEPAPVDLNRVVDVVAGDLELLAADKNATLHKAELPTVRGNEVLLQQLFSNLLSNSLKFSKEAEPLKIEVSSEAVVKNSATFIRIRVMDNGIGFEHAYEETVFEAFTRLHPKDKYEGTGLGLALCKKIVERHGGTITAEGNIGKGAVFTIMLPA